MPIYGTFTIPTAIYPGDQALLIGTLTNPSTPISSAVGETKGTGAALTGALSERIALPDAPWSTNSLKSLDIELRFSADPGTFEFDMMGSDTDDANFTQIGTNKLSTAAVSPITNGPLFIATLTLVNLTNRFFALYCKTQPTNTVTVIGKVSR